MHNLKAMGGTYKGLIGEYMFKLTRKWAVLNKCWKPDRYLLTFSKYYNTEQINFIRNNWHSLDSLEITYKKGFKENRLYEIKTKNMYRKLMFKKHKITRAALDMYIQAQKMGFSVYLAEVFFLDDWNYHVKIKPFAGDLFFVDEMKKYDKAIFSEKK